MSLFSAIHTYDSRISAGGNFEREKEETMEKIINNAPFALVLVFLVIGFVLLIKGAIPGPKGGIVCISNSVKG